ncbi:UdgX family uracil-DNA binding protein [Maritalea sp.]|uniref:UdgX family uracil-DNA binding protein n=1 Tax=Maritalea sp. TaxID=2003361 RepID=UPI003EF46BD5
MNHEIVLEGRGDFEEWRHAARQLCERDISPDQVIWRTRDNTGDLFDVLTGKQQIKAQSPSSMRVPKRFVQAAKTAICHTDKDRFTLLYRVLHQLKSHPNLIDDQTHPDIAKLNILMKNVHRDSHKMKAFVRFKEVDGRQQGRRRFVAWFEPEHYTIERTSPFFKNRFSDMDWLIASPKGAAAWDGNKLSVSRDPAEPPIAQDQTDELWCTYFANIFNPARLKVRAMQSEMPKKYWKNLPEAALIPDLIAGAEKRVLEMAAKEASQPRPFHDRIQAQWQEKPKTDEGIDLTPLEQMRNQAASCTRCPLHCRATQTIFGEGPSTAQIMVVGEQPGDQEDLAGRPFIGPAGKIFDEALAQAQLNRSELYITNAVKHFKYKEQGKRRLHERPTTGEVEHCRWWLTKEMALIQPEVIIAMGATAYFALTGEKHPIARVRGTPIPMQENTTLLVTTHPAAILRNPDKVARQKMLNAFYNDMQKAQHLSAALI